MSSECFTNRYIDFYTDFAFQRLFGTENNRDLLIGFLNAMLDGRETVEEVTYLNINHLHGQGTVVDVSCKNGKGEHFLVEVQKGEQPDFDNRSIYHSAFVIGKQASHGVWDYKLKGIYVIGILNFCLDQSGADYLREIQLMEMGTGEVFYDKLTFFYLEMPKFTKREEELETLRDRWLYAIRSLPTLTDRPGVLQETIFTRLFEAAEIARLNPQERREYLESLKAMGSAH